LPLSLGQDMSTTIGSPRQKALVAFLIEKRKAAGLSQIDLANKLKRYQSFVARLESGQRRVDVVELVDLSEILGFDPTEALKLLRSKKRS